MALLVLGFLTVVGGAACLAWWGERLEAAYHVWFDTHPLPRPSRPPRSHVQLRALPFNWEDDPDLRREGQAS